jgi:hypothetical protein
MATPFAASGLHDRTATKRMAIVSHRGPRWWPASASTRVLNWVLRLDGGECWSMDLPGRPRWKN